MKPTVLILHASGTNRDGEAARACELAGGVPEIVHINQLRRGERRLPDYRMLLLPGGFTYGDALGAGTRLALDLEVFFHDALHEFVASGRLVLGICNGFQTLVKAGILPGWTNGWQANAVLGTDGPDQPARAVTLTENAGGRFECRWVHLAVEPHARASFLRQVQEPIFCPIAHGEGNLQVGDAATRQRLEAEGYVALRYVDRDGRPAGGRYPINPNGSVADIAGLCNQQGNVLGLMPHPEDHISSIQNPLGREDQLGLPLFQSMVQVLG